METIDFKKEWKPLYQPSAKEVVQVDVPEHNYLMVDGQGDPNTADSYTAAVEALFSLSYAVKFKVKKGPLAVDYGVLPLEGLWWTDDLATFTVDDKSNWQWTVMILQPAFVTAALVAEAAAEVKKKKNPPALGEVRFQAFSEGLCAQLLHVGPFSAEGPSVERLHRFITDSGRKPRGKHHEIYLSDVRKTDPAKWKTVLRQPME